MPASTASRAGLAIALASLLLVPLVPTAGAHADVGIELEAREGADCTGSEVCLELIALPPDLAPGHATVFELRVHPEAEDSYRAALTTADRADPDRQATPASAAIVTTPEAEPGETVRVNLTSPDATQGYAWLVDEDHEAKGGWEAFPLGEQPPSDGTAQAPLGLAPLMVAIAAALTAFQRRAGGLG